MKRLSASACAGLLAACSNAVTPDAWPETERDAVDVSTDISAEDDRRDVGFDAADTPDVFDVTSEDVSFVPDPPDGAECDQRWAQWQCLRLYATPDDPRPHFACCRGRCAAAGSATCLADGWTIIGCGREPECDVDAGRFCCRTGTSFVRCFQAGTGQCNNF